MKTFKITVILLFLFISRLYCQVIPQCDHSSCWAASLAMVSKSIDVYPKNQYHFIIARNSIRPISTVNWSSPCDCSTTTIPEKDMFNIAHENLLGYNRFSNYSLGLHHINNLTLRKKPIIYDYRLETTSSHIVLIDAVENVVFNDNKNISFLKIKDPWPKCVGNEYLMTYERYYEQNRSPMVEGVHSGKYTISFDECTESDYGINDIDRNYLNKVIYEASSEKVILSLINRLKTYTSSFSSSFFNLINLSNWSSSLLSLKITNEFYVTNVGSSTYATSLTEPILPLTIETLLNRDYMEMISCISQDDKVKTIISTSNKPYNGIYPFYKNWVIYHLENGERNYASFLELAKKAGMEVNVVGDKGLILRAVDTYFAVLKQISTGKYFVYDIYGDGFRKMDNQISPQKRFMDYDEFNKILDLYNLNNLNK
jgi:hypothetical protein